MQSIPLPIQSHLQYYEMSIVVISRGNATRTQPAEIIIAYPEHCKEEY